MGNSASSQPQAHPEGKTMQGVVFAKYGKPDAVLELRDNLPRPGANLEAKEVAIKVRAAALNPIDKLRVEGGLKALKPEPFFPMVLGYDVAGVVEAVGSEVSGFKAGDEVYVRLTSTKMGAFAEYVVAHEDRCALKPKELSFEEAAACPLAAVTALQMLRDRLGVKEGDKVFISGGAGGVGSFAIQLAKHVLKASVVATTASPGEKTELCTSLGADVVINYREQKFEEELKDYDVAFDTTHESAKMPQILKEGGKVATISDTPTVEELQRIGMNTNFVVRTFLRMGRNKAALAAAAKQKVEWSYMFLQPNGDDLRELATFVGEGKVKPVIDNVWDFKDWKGAVERSFSGRSKGKCVIRMPVEEPAAEEPAAEEPAAEEPAAEEPVVEEQA